MSCWIDFKPRTTLIGVAVRATQINLVGGLGNQLFGFAAGKYLEEIHGHIVRYNTWHIARGLTNHGFTLQNRGLIGDFFSEPPEAKWRNFQHRHFRSKEVGWDPELDSLRPGRTVEGYFQSWRYLKKLDPQSITPEKLLLREKTTEWFAQLLSKVKSERPLMVHFRRGDYRTVQNTMGLLELDYYKRALELARNKLARRRFWVFSDEPDVAERFFSRCHVDFIVMSPPKDSDPGESLFLMSQGAGHVISNSTFAWWAAALSSSSSFVVAPKPWLKTLDTITDLLPPRWIRVPHGWGKSETN